MTVICAADPGGPVRVGYAVGRRVGSAVVRNRVRRRLRELMEERAREGELPGGTYLVSVAPDVAEMGFDDLRDALGTTLDAVSGSRR